MATTNSQNLMRTDNELSTFTARVNDAFGQIGKINTSLNTLYARVGKSESDFKGMGVWKGVTMDSIKFHSDFLLQ
jgi:ABC-type transporter Mla subunit MlaD